MRRYIAPLLLTAVLLYSCSSDPDTGSRGPFDVTVPADLMGLVHAGSKILIADDSNVEVQYDLLDDIAVSWTLTDFSWSTIQTESKKDDPPVEWNWASFDNYVKNGNDRGKKILAILDYDTEWLHGGNSGEKETVIDHMGGNTQVDIRNDGHLGRCIIGDYEIAKFCAYVTATVTRYNGKNGYGKVDAWRIWNEPNLFPRFWAGNMDDFFKLSKAAAQAIRKADPDAVIVVGALNSIADDDWIKELYSSGAAKQADFVAFHPYSTGSLGTDYVFRNFQDKTSSVFRNKIWVTEVGHPTGGTYPTKVSEVRMPQTIVKTIVLLSSRGVQKIFWYHLADGYNQSPTDSEDWFGLFATESDGSLVPKGYLPNAYKLCAEHIPGKTWRVSGLPGLSLPNNIQTHYFIGDDGKCLLVVWNDGLTDISDVNITLPGTGHVLHDPADASSAPVAASGSYQLSGRDSVNEKILFFTWDAD